MTDATTLTLFTVYERPLDFPNEFVARRYEIANAQPLATEHVLRSGELAQLRREHVVVSGAPAHGADAPEPVAGRRRLHRRGVAVSVLGLPREARAEHRGQALAGYVRPWSKGLRARCLTIEVEHAAGKRRRVVATVPRTADAAADHAVAETIIAAFFMADAVRQLLRDGGADDFGTFTYLAPPRRGADAVARLRELLEVTPPPPLERCLVCRVRCADDG